MLERVSRQDRRPVPDRGQNRSPRPAPGGADLLSVQRSAGNAAVLRLLAERPAPAPGDGTIRRRLIPETGAPITSAIQVRALPDAVGMAQGQIDRLIALAIDGENHQLDDALIETRNTVVAAVNGASPSELAFLAAAWGARQNLTAYDPDMVGGTLQQLQDRGVDPTTTQVNQGSITQFGQHVPHTEILVPHPGPWVTAGEDDLASCLDHVLGPNSVAYVLTDTEPSPAYSQILATRVAELNQARVQVGGNVVADLEIDVEVVTLETDGTTELGGVPIRVTHEPNFRLVTIRRS